MKSFFRFALLALMLLVVALLSALTAMRLAIHGREVAVPDLVGKTPAPPGTQVRRGWQIRVAESLGPQRVAIPNVVGQSERAAEINIEHRGLNVGAIARLEFPDATPGEVVSQAPPSNASSVSAPKISLLVSEPSHPQSFVMPNFVGQPLGSVTLALQDAGFRLGAVTAQSGPAAGSSVRSPASIVVSQNPAAGAKVMAGSAITFVVQ